MIRTECISRKILTPCILESKRIVSTSSTSFEELNAKVNELYLWKSKEEGQRNSDFYKFGFTAVGIIVGAIFGKSHIDSRIDDLKERIIASEHHTADQIRDLKDFITVEFELKARVDKLESESKTRR